MIQVRLSMFSTLLLTSYLQGATKFHRCIRCLFQIQVLPPVTNSNKMKLRLFRFSNWCSGNRGFIFLRKRSPQQNQSPQLREVVESSTFNFPNFGEDCKVTPFAPLEDLAQCNPCRNSRWPPAWSVHEHDPLQPPISWSWATEMAFGG